MKTTISLADLNAMAQLEAHPTLEYRKKIFFMWDGQTLRVFGASDSMVLEQTQKIISNEAPFLITASKEFFLSKSAAQCSLIVSAEQLKINDKDINFDKKNDADHNEDEINRFIAQYKSILEQEKQINQPINLSQLKSKARTKKNNWTSLVLNAEKQAVQFWTAEASEAVLIGEEALDLSLEADEEYNSLLYNTVALNKAVQFLGIDDGRISLATLGHMRPWVNYYVYLETIDKTIMLAPMIK